MTEHSGEVPATDRAAEYPADLPSENKPERFVGETSNEGMTETDDGSEESGEGTSGEDARSVEEAKFTDDSVAPPADYDPADDPSNTDLVSGENPE